MWLINTSTLQLEDFIDHKAQRYAILSHRWQNGEVNHSDMKKNRCDTTSQGYKKIKEFCKLAAQEGHNYVWVDTCCIDKKSSAELQEAINSMYQWYEGAAKCYAYLCDIDGQEDFTASEWFDRGWTLQELLAPDHVSFYDCRWVYITSRSSAAAELNERTRVPKYILKDEYWESRRPSIHACTAAEVMSWASDRKTSRLEDRAYSLLGLFGIEMPLLYGEGANAFLRLQKKILKRKKDGTLFLWHPYSPCSDQLLSLTPDVFSRFLGVRAIPSPEPHILPRLNHSVGSNNGSGLLSHQSEDEANVCSDSDGDKHGTYSLSENNEANHTSEGNDVSSSRKHAGSGTSPQSTASNPGCESWEPYEESPSQSDNESTDSSAKNFRMPYHVLELPQDYQYFSYDMGEIVEMEVNLILWKHDGIYAVILAREASVPGFSNFTYYGIYLKHDFAAPENRDMFRRISHNGSQICRIHSREMLHRIAEAKRRIRVTIYPHQRYQIYTSITRPFKRGFAFFFSQLVETQTLCSTECNSTDTARVQDPSVALEMNRLTLCWDHPEFSKTLGSIVFAQTFDLDLMCLVMGAHSSYMLTEKLLEILLNDKMGWNQLYDGKLQGRGNISFESEGEVAIPLSMHIDTDPDTVAFIVSHSRMEEGFCSEDSCSDLFKNDSHVSKNFAIEIKTAQNVWKLSFRRCESRLFQYAVTLLAMLWRTMTRA